MTPPPEQNTEETSKHILEFKESLFRFIEESGVSPTIYGPVIFGYCVGILNSWLEATKQTETGSVDTQLVTKLILTKQMLGLIIEELLHVHLTMGQPQTAEEAVNMALDNIYNSTRKKEEDGR